MLRLVALTLALLVSTSHLALAQQTTQRNVNLENTVILSWRSNGLAPAGYEGRVAAAGGGDVLISAEVLVDGKPASLTPYDVRWYRNDQLYESGFGKQTITIPIPELHQRDMDIRVEVFGAPFPSREGAISIPLTNPVAVIVNDTRGTITTGETVLSAEAYSFNASDVRDLNYFWEINGNAPDASTDPRSLTLSASGAITDPVSVALRVVHPERDTETAGARVTLSPLTTQ